MIITNPIIKIVDPDELPKKACPHGLLPASDLGCVREPVSYAANCQNVCGIRGIFLDLLPELADVNVYDTIDDCNILLGIKPVRSSSRVNTFPGRGHESSQQIEFVRGELEPDARPR